MSYSKNKRHRKRSETVIICAPAEAEIMVAGSRFDLRCADCHNRVMMAPTGQKYFKAHPDAGVICLACFTRRAPAKAEFRSIASIEELEAEMRTVQPNLWRMRN